MFEPIGGVRQKEGCCPTVTINTFGGWQGISKFPEGLWWDWEGGGR